MQKNIITKLAALTLGVIFAFAGCATKNTDNADTKLGATNNAQKSAVDFYSGKISNLEFKSSLIEKIRKENLGDQIIIFKIVNEDVN